MKKILLLLVVLLLTNVNAQDILLGVKGGLNLSQITSQKRNTRVAYHYGVMAEFKVENERFTFQPEILYSAQGYTIRYKKTNHSKTGKYDYIAIPIMFKYYLSDELNLQVGPQFSFNVKSEFGVDSNNGSTSLKMGERALKTFDFSIGAGVGYKFSNKFNLTIRYNLGATDIYRLSPQSQIQSQTLIRNSVFQFSVGYYFFH